MHAQFKQAVVIDGVKFPIHQNGAPMVHDVPAKIAKHKHFKRFVDAGLIVKTDDEAPAAQESIDERNQRLHKRFTTQVQKVESDPVEDESQPEAEESFDEHHDDEADVDHDSEEDFDQSGAAESDDEMGEDFGDEESEPDESEPQPKKLKAKSKKKKKVKKKH